jgi:hypothetical protein
MDQNGYIREMASVMEEKFNKYWGDCNLLMFLAVVLDLRFKTKFINFRFSMIYKDAHQKCASRFERLL